jgi:predicted aconitase with swiveling domain
VGEHFVREGRAYAAGEADGVALVLSEPLSFWGGIDVTTGHIIDRTHPDVGKRVTAAILIMPGGRGSSSSSSVLAESLRNGTGPAGIVIGLPDPILTVGAIVAESLYGVRCPIVVSTIEGFATGARVRIRAGMTGSAEVEQW